VATVHDVYRYGRTVGVEIRELLNVCVVFTNGDPEDPLLARFGSKQYINEMRKVFFSVEENQFGHSYHSHYRGPEGRNDLDDVIELLRREPYSKRAVVTFVGAGDGKVPCINAIHFLLREEALNVTYFSRGQEIYRKFYADGACVFEMASRVAKELNVPLTHITGMISSAHIYLEDLPAVRSFLTDARAFLGQETTLDV